MEKQNCPHCEGKGFHSHLIINKQCQNCKGKGFLTLNITTNKMSRLDEIKEEVAKEKGFRDWRTFKLQKYANNVQKGQDEVTVRYARECIEATLLKMIDDNKYFLSSEEGEDGYVVEVDDLIRPENIVML